MEIIFLLISIIISPALVYGIGRLVFNHKQLIKAYKDSELLFPIHMFFGLILITVLFITLCAFNNTFWHMPYLSK